MYFSGLSGCFSAEPVARRNSSPKISENSAPTKNSDVVSDLRSKNLKVLSPAEPRTESGKKFWSGIKLLGARVSQNFMALVYTGRLKSTPVENLKEALKEKFGSQATENEKALWFENVYCRHNDLLNIGCSFESINSDLEGILPSGEWDSIKKEYKTFSDNLESHICRFASGLVSSFMEKYYDAKINGDTLLAHSIFKDIERLFLRLGESDNSLRDIANEARNGIRSTIHKKLCKAVHRPHSEGKGRIDSRLVTLKEKLYGMARPIMDKQEARIISGNVKNILSSISALNQQSKKEDFEGIALLVTKTSFFIGSEQEFSNIRQEAWSQLAMLKPDGKRKIEIFDSIDSGKLYSSSQCSFKDAVMKEVNFDLIRKAANTAAQQKKANEAQKVYKDVEKILAVICGKKS